MRAGWLEDADKRRHKLVRATNVLRSLCSDGGKLKSLLGAVAEDFRADVARVRSDVDVLKQDSHRAALIAEADRLRLGSTPRSDITGAARAWLQHGIQEACELAAQWCELVERGNETGEQAQNKWLSNKVSELRSKIESSSQTVLRELSEIAADVSRIDRSASAKCLARSMLRLLDYLGIEKSFDLEPEIPTVVRGLETIVSRGGSQRNRNRRTCGKARSKSF